LGLFLDLVTYPKVATADVAAANRAIDPRCNQPDARYVAVAIFRRNTDDKAMDFLLSDPEGKSGFCSRF
jgi:hypothetical protein